MDSSAQSLYARHSSFVQASARSTLGSADSAKQKLSFYTLFALSFQLSPTELVAKLKNDYTEEDLDQFLHISKLLLDEFAQLSVQESRETISVMLDGEEIILEQFTLLSQPYLQISYRGYIKESPIPMTVDAWAVRLIDHLKHPDSGLSKLYGEEVDSLCRERYAHVSCQHRDFSNVVFQPDEICLASISQRNGINFEGANLCNAVFANAFLDSASFNHAALAGADLTNASLKECTFVGVELTTVALTPKQLSEADLTGALLNGKPVTRLNLVQYMVDLVRNGAKDLRGVNFTGAFFSNVDLSRADLTNANLTFTTFTDVNLTNAKLHGANLTNAKLTSVDASNAKLTQANLAGAEFIDTVLEGTNFSKATLKKTQFTDLSLCCTQLSIDQLFHTTLTDITLHGQVPNDLLVKKWVLVHLRRSKVDVSRVSFSGADLSNEDLSGADLFGMDFSGADLTNANIENCIFTGTNLAGTKFAGIELSALNLTPTQLSEANLDGALLFDEEIEAILLRRQILFLIREGAKDLQKVDISGANLNNLDLSNAELEHADLTISLLVGVNLAKANLFEANLYCADLTSADCSEADLTKANLEGANLTGTNLSGSVLAEANLRNAWIYGADFSGANLDDVALTLHLPYWTEITLKQHFTQYAGNTRNLLTAIESIDDCYAELKIRLIQEVLRSLKDINVDNIDISLPRYLFSNPIYEKNEEIFEFLVKKFEYFVPVNPGDYSDDTSPMAFDSDLELRFLLHLTSETIKLAATSEIDVEASKPTDFMLEHTVFSMQLLTHGMGHEDEKIRALASRLYHHYINLEEMVPYQAHTMITTLEEINSITDEELALVLRCRDANNQTHALILSPKMMRSMLNGDPRYDWSQLYYLKNGQRPELTEAMDIYPLFPLLNAQFKTALSRRIFSKLLDTINLNFTNDDNTEYVNSRDYTNDFKTALEHATYEKDLTSYADQYALQQIFGPLLDEERGITDIHYNTIVGMYELIEDSTIQAQTFFGLAAAATTYSSAYFFATEANSPVALRNYALGLMTKAYKLDPRIFLNKKNEDQFLDWKNKLKGVQGAFECTAVLKGTMRDHAAAMGFENILYKIMPALW